ncbi:uncharacterized protein LOC121730447 [Aricia agestis]|uniref:uncharacterized protein LOC121730447 n=1 Tax=Aricia agestis TaxID=91739 RepID=UPI001C201740|nr:uncharacterized protein LOC121730447 [Aricia agestis]
MAEPGAIPPLALAVFTASAACAATFANFALLAALFKTTKNGLFYILIQLAVADILLLGTSLWLEIWSSNTKTWIFGTGICIAYRGLSVFASSASLYLVITVTFHTLATINLEQRTAQKNKRSDDDEEIKCSRHSLVASDTSTPRTMNVDYGLVKTKVPIALPTAFVWTLAASLSVPEFILSTTVKNENDLIECTLQDSSHKRYMHSMLSIFNLFLPLLILSTSFALIVCKLRSKKKLIRNDANDSVAALKLSLSLIVVYFLFSAPRSLFYAYGLHAMYNNDLQIIHSPLSINLILCAANLLACLIRPLLCIILTPKLRKYFVFYSNGSTADV